VTWKHFRTAAIGLAFITVGAVAGAGAAKLAIPTPKAFIEGDYVSYQQAAGQPVVLLGTQSCPYCKQARVHLETQRVAFADIDVEQSERGKAWFAELRAEGVPVLLIGDRQIRGFNAAAIDEALAALR